MPVCTNLSHLRCQQCELIQSVLHINITYVYVLLLCLLSKYPLAGFRAVI